MAILGSNQSCDRLFKPTTVISVILLLPVGVLLINRIALKICHSLPIGDCPPQWPISVFTLRAPPRLYYPNSTHALIGVLTIGLFISALFILPRVKYHKTLVILFGFGIILGSNLSHGIEYGLERPIDGLGKRTNQYIHDARRIEELDTFLPEYPERQLKLQTHSRSHPPGAVLLFYFFDWAFKDPIIISLFIASTSTVVTGLALHKLLSRFYSSSLTGFLVFATFSIPAIQIYYLASIDAIIASLTIAYFAFALQDKGLFHSLIAALFLFLLSLLTFAFIFIILIMLAYVILGSQRNSNALISLAFFLAFHFVFWGITNFSYINAFRVASALENPGGYRLFVDPANFILTRFEGIFEWLLFAGPLLIAGVICGLRSSISRSSIVYLPVFVGLTFLVILLAGVYRTGETARAAMFFYPLLIPTIGSIFPPELKSVNRKSTIFISFLFFQGLIMQFIGNYFW